MYNSDVRAPQLLTCEIYRPYFKGSRSKDHNSEHVIIIEICLCFYNPGR